jgi:hypothetical protein
MATKEMCVEEVLSQPVLAVRKSAVKIRKEGRLKQFRV